MPVNFTGERYAPEVGGEIRLEHMHRYAFCLPYVNGMTVLDAACGEGYGSALLATKAQHVLGVDISHEAVEAARERYRSITGLEFRQGDATMLDLPDAAFDVVVSFETIEHVMEQESMMRGFARVLKPNGVLILSSPDKRVYSDLTGYRNEFHVKELYRSELEDLVRRHFQRWTLLGQRLAGGSAIFPMDDSAGSRVRKSSVYVDGPDGPEERAANLDEAVYLLVLATNSQILPRVLPSVLLSEREDPLVELKRIARWASGVHEELMLAKAQAATAVQAATAQLEAERARADELQQRLVDATEMVDEEMQRVRKDMALRLATQLQQRDARIAELESLLERARASTPAVPAVAPDGAAAPQDAAGAAGETNEYASALAEALARASDMHASLQRERELLQHQLAESVGEPHQAGGELQYQPQEGQGEDEAAAQGEAPTAAGDSARNDEADAIRERLQRELEEATSRQALLSSQLVDTIASFTQQVDGLLAQLAAQTTLAEQAHQREQELRRAVQRLEGRNEQLQTEAAQAAARVAMAETAARAQQEAMRLEIELARSQQQQDQAEVARRDRELQGERERHKTELRAAVERFELERAALDKAVQEQAARADSARHDLDVARQRASDDERAWLTRVHALEAAADQLRAQARESDTARVQAVERLERAVAEQQAAAEQAAQQEHERIERLSAEHAHQLAALQERHHQLAAMHQAALAQLAELRRASDDEARGLRAELLQANRRRSEAEIALHRQADDSRRQLQHQAALMAEHEASARRTMSAMGDRIASALQDIMARLRDERPRLSGVTGLVDARSRRLVSWLETHLSALLAQLPRGEGGASSRLAGPVPLGRALRLKDGEFLHEAYRAILGRTPDEGGLAHYSARLSRGEPRMRVLRHLRLSPEGQARTPSWPELDESLAAYAASRIPLLGRVDARRLRELTADRGTDDATAWVVQPAATDQRRLADIEYAVNDLSSGASLLAEAVPLAVALGKVPAELGVDAWASAKELVRLEGGDFVRLTYALLYRREPDAAELRHATQRLAGGASRAYLVQTLLDAQRDAGMPQPPRSRVVLALGGAALLPASQSPRVSIVIPVHGHVDYTLRCLRAVALHTADVAAEVIVVDDASPDDSRELLQQVPGLRLLHNETNLGFIGSCNRGAQAARGELLCFLNNDTEVHAGWLTEMCRTLDIFPGTGLVGAKLVYPDGSLQEAGGVLFADGSAANVGRHGDASDPAYDHAREVDYCSGACILMPRHLFEAIGGFDPRYAPAYCEDSDLALKLAERGYRVVYQSCAVVTHYEGVTAGTDPGSGVKAHQVTNTAKLRERWQAALARHPAPGLGLDAALARRAPRRVLVVELRLPRPDRDAGSVSVLNMLLLLREMGWRVTLMVDEPPAPGDDMADAIPLLQRCGMEVLLPPRVESIARHLESSGRRYDLALLFRPVVMERHAGTLRRISPETRIAYYPHDLHFLRMRRQAELTADATLAREAQQWRERELALVRAADLTLVPSRVEYELLVQECPHACIELLPLQLDTTRGPEGRAGRNGMVFVGHFGHAPNVDALRVLVEDVMPRLRQLRPDIELTVVGASLPADFLARRDPGLAYLGVVSDLAPLYAKSIVAVAPLRFGAGAKGKVARAMAAGVPVVASTLAVEGMDLTAAEHVLIADNADAVVGEVLRLHDDAELWQRLADEGHRLASRLWGPRRAYDSLAAALAKAGVAVDPPRYPPRLFREELFLQPPAATIPAAAIPAGPRLAA